MLRVAEEHLGHNFDRHTGDDIMSRKLILTAVVLAGGLFAVGCGNTSTSGSATPPSGGRTGGALDDAKRKAEEELKKGTEAAGAFAGKVKEAQDEITKELEPVNKKIKELKDKVATEKDAGLIAEANKMLQAGEPKLNAILDMIKNNFGPDKLKGLMENDGLAKLKKEIMDKIADLKKTIGL
jgi:hypothetical protein